MDIIQQLNEAKNPTFSFNYKFFDQESKRLNLELSELSSKSYQKDGDLLALSLKMKQFEMNLNNQKQKIQNNIEIFSNSIMANFNKFWNDLNSTINAKK